MTIEERINKIVEERRKKVDKELETSISNVEKVFEIFEKADTEENEYLWKMKICSGNKQLWGDWDRLCFWFGDILNNRTTFYNIDLSIYDSKKERRHKYYDMAKEINNLSPEEINVMYQYLKKNFSDKFYIRGGDHYLEIELKL